MRQLRLVEDVTVAEVLFHFLRVRTLNKHKISEVHICLRFSSEKKYQRPRSNQEAERFEHLHRAKGAQLYH